MKKKREIITLVEKKERGNLSFLEKGGGKQKQKQKQKQNTEIKG